MSTTNIGASILTGSQLSSTSGGLGSGIDISALVQASMANQTAELALMQKQQSAISSQQTALQNIGSDMQALQNAVFALTDPVGEFTSVAATSSNPAAVSATAISGTPTGSHSLTIANLASTSSAYSTAVASGSTTVATGSLSIRVGSNAAQTVTIDSTNNTLNGLAAAINGIANIGVTANVITDSSGARLVLVSNTSGAAGNLTITPSPGTLTFNTGTTGVNASLNVDGIPISSATNTVSSAIPGVTLTLTGATGSAPVSVITGPDIAQQESAVNGFVSAYNKVIGDLNAQFAIDPTSGNAGPLGADGTIALAQSQLLAAAGFATTGNGPINSLASLGISMNDDGTLSVDNSVLSTALQGNAAAVQNFFQSAASGSFGSNLSKVLSSVADPLTGALAQDANGLAQSQNSLTQQISDFQSQLAVTQQQLTAQFVQVDTTLQQLPQLLDQINQQLASLG